MRTHVMLVSALLCVSCSKVPAPPTSRVLAMGAKGVCDGTPLPDGTIVMGYGLRPCEPPQTAQAAIKATPIFPPPYPGAPICKPGGNPERDCWIPMPIRHRPGERGVLLFLSATIPPDFWPAGSLKTVGVVDAFFTREQCEAEVLKRQPHLQKGFQLQCLPEPTS